MPNIKLSLEKDWPIVPAVVLGILMGGTLGTLEAFIPLYRGIVGIIISLLICVTVGLAWGFSSIEGKSPLEAQRAEIFKEHLFRGAKYFGNAFLGGLVFRLGVSLALYFFG